ncbi:MAG TPA: hypothetical protein VGN69_04550 [Solirubrobacteraceae bacterium]|jgi:hypothetical protein|nr:hypothetical protein [Solirubrobacteraceae bacterium]
MYQFSRAIYRELAPYIEEHRMAQSQDVSSHAHVLHSCEAAVERLITDRHYFARPTRSLFQDIRAFFPVTCQHRVFEVVSRYMSVAQEFAERQPRQGCDANGNPLQCRATTRKGSPCQRAPLPINGYCPSHQHLAATEDTETLVAA